VREWMSHSSTMMQHNHNTEVRSKCAYIDRLCCCSGRDISKLVPATTLGRWRGSAVTITGFWDPLVIDLDGDGRSTLDLDFRATNHWQTLHRRWSFRIGMMAMHADANGP
jgi:hypothetical protein